MIGLTLTLLGPFEATIAGQPLPAIRTRKALALLIYLAASPAETLVAPAASRFGLTDGHALPRETLMDLLWPDMDTGAARLNLRQALYQLRQALSVGLDPATAADQPTLLLADRQMVRLNEAAGLAVDVRRMAVLLGDYNQHQRAGRFASGHLCDRCRPWLEEATTFYRGPFLAGVPLPESALFADWALAQRAFWQRQALRCLERLTVADLEAGRHSQAVAHARQQLALDPLRESGLRQLLQALAGSGRHPEALHQYDLYRRELAVELQTRPTPETRDLVEAIRRGEAIPTTQAPVPAIVQSEPLTVPDNLPNPATPFFDRPELTRLVALIDELETRLVTVLAPGGMGKTRLALATGAYFRDRQPHRFPEGVFFVPLSGRLGSPVAANRPVGAAWPELSERLALAIAGAMGLSLAKEGQPGTASVQLLGYLRRRQALLILDSYEHLLPAVDLIVSLGSAAPDLVVLVTSREKLALQSEQLFPLDGLACPGSTEERLAVGPAGDRQPAATGDAVRFFEQSARRVRPGFCVTSRQLQAITEICRQVQGMPLALELAASWLELLSPAAIARRLQVGLDLLQTDRQDVPPRHRSMRAVFEGTWQRLTEKEQQVLAALSVFRGGFARSAAANVATDLPSTTTLMILAALAGRSLLQYDPEADRYDLHPLLRQFAAEKLAQRPDYAAATRQRHARHYGRQLAERLTELKGAAQSDAVAAIESELANIQAAWSWLSAQGDVRGLLAALPALGLFTFRHGLPTQGIAACQEARANLPPMDPGPRLAARLMTWEARFETEAGRAEVALGMLAQALDGLHQAGVSEVDSRFETAFIWEVRAEAEFHRDRRAAEAAYQRSLALYRMQETAWEIANVLNELGRIAHHVGRYTEAEPLLEEALSLRRAIQDQRGITESLIWSGFNALRLGQVPVLIARMEQAMALKRAVGDRTGLAFIMSRYGLSYLWIGQMETAQRYASESQAISEELGQRFEWVYASMTLSCARTFSGDYEAGDEEARAGAEVARRHGYQRELAILLVCQGLVALAQARAGAAVMSLENAWQLLAPLEVHDDESWVLTLLALAGWIQARRRAPGPEAVTTIGKGSPAHDRLFQALDLALPRRSYAAVIFALLTWLRVLIDGDDVEGAVFFHALCSCIPMYGGSPWYMDVVGRDASAMAARLPPSRMADIRARAEAADLWVEAGRLLERLREIVTG